MSRRQALPSVIFLLALGILEGRLAAEGEGQLETLCILDFHRLDGSKSMDWLQRGLADMMITAINRLGHFQVVQRQRLREILREHRWARSQATDVSTAIRTARLVKAQGLILGSYWTQSDVLHVEVRLLGLDDGQLMAASTWQGKPGDVLQAPRVLAQRLLAHLEGEVEPQSLEGLERAFPRSIDAAEAYFNGERSFDIGDLGRALACYLDSARASIDDFLEAPRAVVKTYRLLKLSGHAAQFALKMAARCEAAGDRQHAAEFYFSAAATFLESGTMDTAALHWLERTVHVAERHEEETGESERTKAAVRARAVELKRSKKYRGKSGRAILSHPDIRFKIWHQPIDRQLAIRARLEAKGGIWRREARQPVPELSLFMWRIRALYRMAQLSRRLGRLKDAFESYGKIRADYEFLDGLPLFSVGDSFYWHQGIKNEVANILYKKGLPKNAELLRDPVALEILEPIFVSDGTLFVRDFSRAESDHRARWRYEQSEGFDFVAEEGLVIDSILFEAEVNTMAGFNFHPDGGKHVLKRGSHQKQILFPPGVEHINIGSTWGGILLLNHPEVHVLPRLFTSSAKRDIESWKATFRLSTNSSRPAPSDQKSLADNKRTREDQKRVETYQRKEGWEAGQVDHRTTASDYLKRSQLRNIGMEWRVDSVDGDLYLSHRDNRQLTVSLPWEVNSDEGEFDPALLRTHEGEFALLWARGPRKQPDTFFVAFSSDLVDWRRPHRLEFSGAAAQTSTLPGATPSNAKTSSVVAVRSGYVMVSDDGSVRRSDDLRVWSSPQKLLPQNASMVRLSKTSDGRLWAVYYEASTEEQLYTAADSMLGFYVRDGKKLKRRFDVWVTSTTDGNEWLPPTKVLTHGEPTTFWAFPIDDRRIAVAILFNNRFLKWLAATAPQDFRGVQSPVKILCHPCVGFYAEDNAVFCVREIRNQKKETVTLILSSKQLYKRLQQ